METFWNVGLPTNGLQLRPPLNHEISVKDGKQVPGVSPAAMQMAHHVSHIIHDEITFPGRVERSAFKYWDKGPMATIGRSAAVAKVGSFEISGFFAWLAWLFIHLIFLVGFRNKISVLMSWAYSYVTYKRGSRIITPSVPAPFRTVAAP